MPRPQPPALVLTNGRIWTGREEAEAVVVREGRVVAVGAADEVDGRLASGGEVVDLEGRRVIPGLVDSHTHFVRAGLTWNDIVRWDDVRSLEEGLARIRSAAAGGGRGWIRVLGGWHPGGFPERRGPTREELDAAAPGSPVYVQLLYEEALVSSAGIEAAGLGGVDDPGIERDERGAPTGRLRGAPSFQHVLRHFALPDEDAQRTSTRALAADFNRLGVTGVVDPGGFGIVPESYRPLFALWDSGDLTLRVRLYLVPGERGREVEQVREWVRYVHPGFGDDLLRYTGMGEILTFGCHDMEGVRPFEVSAAARRDLLEISRLLARHRWPVHLHAILDSTISAVLDVWEEVDREIGLAGTRFSFAHAEPIGQENLRRVARLGVGIGVQNRLMFRAADSAAMWGEETMVNSPPLRDILDLGIPLAAGTDATVVAPHDPWRCIWWLVTGESVDGAPPRRPRHRLTVEEALRAYTEGSAWLSLEEDVRGTLAPGMLADLAVLDSDPFSIDADRLPEVRSELTLVGGRPVHAGPAFTGLA